MQGHELKAKLSRLCMEFRGSSILPPPLLLMKNRRIVFLLCCDHVVDDPGEFVGRGGHGFGSTEIPHPLRLHKQLDVT
jgi:hypothetical protein